MSKQTDKILAQDIMPVAIMNGTPFKTPYNGKNFPDTGEKLAGEQASMTIPDQSLTVAELVHRFTIGQSLNGRVPLFEDENDPNVYPPNWDQLDLSEKMDFIKEREQELRDIAAKLDLKKRTEEKLQREKEINEAVERKLQARKDARATFKEQMLPFTGESSQKEAKE